MGKPSKKSILKAINGSDGVISTIAERIGVSWGTARNYIDADPDLLQALDDENNIIIDVAETETYKQVRDGEVWALKYVLSTKGTKRGWIESQRKEITGKDGQPLNTGGLKGMSDEELEALIALAQKAMPDETD